MVFEFNDLKGLLFLVLITIPQTATTNINCNGKPFHCVNSTHFMICVDLGSGVSSTIDDFVIPCPPTTACHANNHFECEFPNIEDIEPSPPLHVIGVSAMNKTSALPHLVYGEATSVQTESTTALITERNLSKLEDEASLKLSEILENLKEEFTGGNEHFFDVTTILPINTVSSGSNLNEINSTNYDNNGIITDNVLNSEFTTETLPDFAREAIATDNSEILNITTPTAISDGSISNLPVINKNTPLLEAPEHSKAINNSHVSTTIFFEVNIINKSLSVPSDTMLLSNHSVNQELLENNFTPPNDELNKDNVVTLILNTKINTTEKNANIKTNHTEPVRVADTPQKIVIENNESVDDKIVHNTVLGYPGKYAKIAFKEDKQSIYDLYTNPLPLTTNAVDMPTTLSTVNLESNYSSDVSIPNAKQEIDSSTKIGPPVLISTDFIDVFTPIENTKKITTDTYTSLSPIIPITTKTEIVAENNMYTEVPIYDSEKINGTIYSKTSSNNPLTEITREGKNENYNGFDKIMNIIFNNKQTLETVSRTPVSYFTNDLYDTTANPPNDNFSTTTQSGHDTTINKMVDDDLSKLEYISKDLHASTASFKNEPGSVSSPTDIFNNVTTKTTESGNGDFLEYENHNISMAVTEVISKNMSPTLEATTADVTNQHAKGTTQAYTPLYLPGSESNKSNFIKSQEARNIITISKIENTTTVSVKEDINNSTGELTSVQNEYIVTTAFNSSNPTANNSSEAHKSMNNNPSETKNNSSLKHVTTDLIHSNEDLNTTKLTSGTSSNNSNNINFAFVPKTNNENENNTIKTTIPVHATAELQTLRPTEMDYSSTLTPEEPSNNTLTEIDNNTSETYNYSSNGPIVPLLYDNVVIIQTKNNTTIFPRQNYVTQESKRFALTEMKDSISNNKLVQNNDSFVTTAKPAMVISRLPITHDGLTLSKSFINDSLQPREEFIKIKSNPKSLLDEVLTTEIHSFDPTEHITAKYSRINKEENLVTSGNEVNLISSNVTSDNLIPPSIIRSAAEMSNVEFHSLQSDQTKTWQSKAPVVSIPVYQALSNVKSGDLMPASVTTTETMLGSGDLHSLSEDQTETYITSIVPDPVDTQASSHVKPGNLMPVSVTTTEAALDNGELHSLSEHQTETRHITPIVADPVDTQALSYVKPGNLMPVSVTTTEAALSNGELHSLSEHQTETRHITPIVADPVDTQASSHVKPGNLMPVSVTTTEAALGNGELYSLSEHQTETRHITPIVADPVDTQASSHDKPGSLMPVSGTTTEAALGNGELHSLSEHQTETRHGTPMEADLEDTQVSSYVKSGDLMPVSVTTTETELSNGELHSLSEHQTETWHGTPIVADPVDTQASSHVKPGNLMPVSVTKTEAALSNGELHSLSEHQTETRHITPIVADPVDTQASSHVKPGNLMPVSITTTEAALGNGELYSLSEHQKETRHITPIVGDPVDTQASSHDKPGSLMSVSGTITEAALGIGELHSLSEYQTETRHGTPMEADLVDTQASSNVKSGDLMPVSVTTTETELSNGELHSLSEHQTETWHGTPIVADPVDTQASSHVKPGNLMPVSETTTGTELSNGKLHSLSEHQTKMRHITPIVFDSVDTQASSNVKLGDLMTASAILTGSGTTNGNINSLLNHQTDTWQSQSMVSASEDFQKARYGNTQTSISVTVDKIEQNKNKQSKTDAVTAIPNQTNNIKDFKKVFKTLTPTIKSLNATKNIKYTNGSIKTITNSINESTSIGVKVSKPTVNDLILSEIILKNGVGNFSQMRNISRLNITSHKEVLQRSMFNDTVNSNKAYNISNRRDINLANRNDALTVEQINIELNVSNKSNDISREDRYASSTTYFGITSNIATTTSKPLVENITNTTVATSSTNLMHIESNPVFPDSVTEFTKITKSKNPNKYNSTYNNTKTFGINKTNIEEIEWLNNLTEQRKKINIKLYASNKETGMANNKEDIQSSKVGKQASNTKDFNARAKVITKDAASPFDCRNNTRGKYADGKDCRKFYICLGKLPPIVGTCPNNTVFSEINKQCTRNLSHCVRNNQFHCLYEGRFSDFLKDNTYYICVKHNLRFLRYKLQCQLGYKLNKITVKCEKNVESSSQSVSSVSENSQINYKNAGTEKVKKSENIDDFECKKEGKYPFSKDCTKYYVCYKNKKNEYRRKIKTCSDDKIYDKENEKCVSAESNEC